jgi:transcriptional regulator with XRE-family HTH domain
MVARIRRTRARIAGDTEATRLAATLGQVVREARRAGRLRLVDVARRVGISPSWLSDIERGQGLGAPLQTWVALGVALQRPLAVGFSRPLDSAGAAGPVDAGHLEIQEAVLRLARATNRPGTFELPTRPTDPRRSTDVGIRDPRRHLRILVECWNTFGDLGAATRATSRKAADARMTWPNERVATVWVVRASAANRRLLARFPHIVEAAFKGSSRQWLQALTDPDIEPPHDPGLVWFDPGKGRLTEHRRARMRP